ncbi:MAG: hypothetical protein RJB38_2243 [Pseudomonadota bacterium]
MRILLAFSDSVANEMVEIALASRYQIELKSATDDDAVSRALVGEKAETFDLIFCDFPARATWVGELLVRGGVETPLVIFGSNVELDQKFAKTGLFGKSPVLAWINWTNWIRDLAEVFGKLPQPPAELQVATEDASEFQEVRTGLLLAISPVPCDIFIRLLSNRHLKIFSKGDVFDEFDYDRYGFQKMVRHFYIRRDGLSPFVERLTQVLQRRLKGRMSQDEATRLAEDLNITVRRIVRHWNPSPEVGELIKLSLNLTLQSIGKNPRLKAVLKKVTAQGRSYLAFHSVALCQISCALATAVGWGSKMTLSKLNFAAFMHDLVLEDEEEIARGPDLKAGLEALAKAKGNDAVARYLSHGVRAAELCRQFKEVPSDVDHILIDHHERPDGNGFPRKLTHLHIAPLAALFIIAHDLVEEIYQKGEFFEYGEFVRARKEVYASGHFKKVLNAIEGKDEA